MLLCDFHREQAWERWLGTTSNGVRADREGILSYLRSIADSETDEAYEKAVHSLRKSPIYNQQQSQRFRNWIENTWLPSHKVLRLLNGLEFTIHKCTASWRNY